MRWRESFSPVNASCAVEAGVVTAEDLALHKGVMRDNTVSKEAIAEILKMSGSGASAPLA